MYRRLKTVPLRECFPDPRSVPRWFRYAIVLFAIVEIWTVGALLWWGVF